MKIFLDCALSFQLLPLLCLLFFYHPLSVNWALHKSQERGDPPLSNFNLRSISNQQSYSGNHQNLLKEKKANFRGPYECAGSLHWLVCEYGPGAAAKAKADCICLWGSGIFSSRWQPGGSISNQAEAFGACRVQAKVSKRTSSCLHTTRWDLFIHFNAFTVQIIIWTVTEDPENVPSREEGK